MHTLLRFAGTVGAILLLANAALKGRRRMPDKYLARLGTGWVISLVALALVGWRAQAASAAQLVETGGDAPRGAPRRARRRAHRAHRAGRPGGVLKVVDAKSRQDVTAALP